MAVLSLNEIPAGEIVSVDANVLVDAFTGLSRSAENLVRRHHVDDLHLVTSWLEIQNTAHRLMLDEASEISGAPISATKLKGRLDLIKRLTRWRSVTRSLLEAGVSIFPSPADHPIDDLASLSSVSEKYGLLVGDSSLVSLTLRFGVAHLATNDRDFDRLPIQVYRVADLVI